MDASDANTKNLLDELAWFTHCLKSRVELAEGKTTAAGAPEKVQLPKLRNQDSAYGVFVNKNGLDRSERLMLILSLVPHLCPQLLTGLFLENNPAHLIHAKTSGMFAPTGETVLYLLCGSQVRERLKYYRLFDVDHLFYKKNVIHVEDGESGFSEFSGLLKIDASYRDLFLLNRYKKPRFSSAFPAHLLTTDMEWDDLILEQSAREKLEEIKMFLTHRHQMEGEMGLAKHMKPGYRCLFYGPSGTGKTLATTLLGKYLNKDVYRVDISALVSKYIGETAKNLDRLFNMAEDRDWILFFDEGDAIFGKRVDTAENDHKNAQYANQEIAHLLQRIETYNGLVILASNKPKNMDAAFSRRFQSRIHFNLPDEPMRQQLWETLLSRNFRLERGLNLAQLNRQHPLSVASIYAVVTRLTMLNLHHGRDTVDLETLKKCMLDEKAK